MRIISFLVLMFCVFFNSYGQDPDFIINNTFYQNNTYFLENGYEVEKLEIEDDGSFLVSHIFNSEDEYFEVHISYSSNTKVESVIMLTELESLFEAYIQYGELNMIEFTSEEGYRSFAAPEYIIALISDDNGINAIKIMRHSPNVKSYHIETTTNP